MKLARRLERRMEGLVEGLSAALFRGRIHPVELADRLLRHIDRNAGTADDVTIPNVYAIRVHPGELPAAADQDELQRELALVVSATATDRGWRIGGPPSVTVTADEKIGHGRIEIEGHREPGRLSPWAQLIDAGAGRVHYLADNRCSIGREPGSDLELAEPRVSRHHATISRSDGSVWLSDAGSANSTYLNEVAISTEPIALATGDVVRFGPATFTFKML
jgi:hypothetical protein